MILLGFLFFAAGLWAQEPAPTRAVPEQGAPPRNLTQRPDGHFSANEDPEDPETFEVYVVQRGDTLSGIAGRVLQNPRLWPQLWELNGHIINPHWIYPNDQVLIRPLTLITEAAPPAPPEPVQDEPVRLTPPRPPALPTPQAPQVTFVPSVPRPVPEVKISDLYCSGFIQEAVVPQNLKVIGKYNGDGSALATESEYIYLSQGAEDGVSAGDMYQVIRPTRRISRTEGRDRNLGTHYLDVAQIRVVLVQPDFSLARVFHSCDVVEMGDSMVPFQRREVPAVDSPRPFGPFMTVTGDVQGAIVITHAVLSNSGTIFKGTDIVPGVQKGDLTRLGRGVAVDGTIVYIDVGQQEGVRPGDVFIVYRRHEVDDDLYDLPREVVRLRQERTAVGELIVIKTGERASTALVTHALVGISAGDSVERR